MREEGYNVIRLDGSLDLDERNRLVKKFNEDASVDVFIIQVNTGGVGYNLQAATHVYINTPTWNPALEYQAIGRAHRTGQTKPVKVTKLITVDPGSNVPTVEEFILQLHDTKLKLIAEVLNDARIAKVEKGTRMRKINEVITFKDISKMFKV
jgi:SNF2 family DNA or RNA helicase